ncbi:hypothetical protein E4U53_003693 [Claviceps sorghi]|nr:hypothetical protein E4U53_003693 [Claviceps sorghi]
MLLIGDRTAVGKEVEEGVADEADTGARDGEGEGEGDDKGDSVPAVLDQLESEHVERMRHLSAEEADAIYADLHGRALAHSGSAKG